MAIIGSTPTPRPLLATVTNANFNPRVVASLTASPWNFTTTRVVGRKRRRGYGYVSPHPPINARLPNATLLDAIDEQDAEEQEREGERIIKRRRLALGSDAIRLPAKTWEEWREDALMDLKTVVFATNTVPAPLPAEESYPTSPTSPAGINPITAGLVNPAGPVEGNTKRETSLGDVVRVGFVVLFLRIL